MAYRHLEDRIVPERIAIVGILVARRDRKHPQPKHLLERVLDALGLAPVPDARRKTRGKPELTDVLAEAHANATETAATDDAGLVERSGGEVCVVDGDAEAFKITAPLDLALAEAVLRSRLR